MNTAELMTGGIHSIPEEQYEADPCPVPSLSSSIAKILVASTPLHAWAAHPRLNPNFVREEKELFDRGNVAHALLLQGIDAAVVLDFDDWRTKAAKEQRDELRSQGRIPLLRKHWEAVKVMVVRAREQLDAHREAKNAFVDGKPEVTLVWEDKASDGTKVMCRGRLDWLENTYWRILDYKTSGVSANPESIARKIIDDGWDIQECMYRRGVKALTGREPDFLFLCQENMDPYALSVIGLGPDMRWLGEKRTQFAIDLWAKCLAENHWPSYPDRVCFPLLPKWAEEAWLAREVRDAV